MDWPTDPINPGVRAQLASLAAEFQAGRPFRLTRGPLLRAGLVRLDEEEHALLLTVHHIVYDGWSEGVLIAELTALYKAALEGRPSPNFVARIPRILTTANSWRRDLQRGIAARFARS